MITYLNMCSPSILAGSDRLVVGIVQKLRILSQTSPQAKLLTSIVALVDQVTLNGIGAVAIGKSLASAVPGFRLETMIIFQAHLDALAEGSEESGLVCWRPTESGPFAVVGRVVTTRASTRVAERLKALGRVVLVFRHGHYEGLGRLGGRR